MKNLRARSLLFLLFGIAYIYPIWAEDRIEINPFGGGSFFARRTFRATNPNAPLRLKVINGGTFGVRVTENIWDYFALEESAEYGINNARFFNVPGVTDRASVTFGSRLAQFRLNGVAHLTPRSSWVRPYITAGYGVNLWIPTDEAKSEARSAGLFGAPTGPIGISSSLRPAFNYGGGIKARLSPHVGLRVDARGELSRTPFFGIPRSGPSNTLSIQGRPSLNGLQVTGGLNFYPDGSEASAGGANLGRAISEGGELVEANFFGGGSFFSPRNISLPSSPFSQPLKMKLVSGYITGVRLTENFWEYFGFEQDFGIYGVNNVRFSNAPGVPNGNVSFHSRLHQFSFNIVGHAGARDSRVRPFATAGLGFNVYRPTDGSRAQARNPVNPLFGAAGPIDLDRSLKAVFNYGVGVKAKLTPYFGVRFDARGFISQTPFFGIPRVGPPNTITIPSGGALYGLQLTGGGTFYFGQAGPKIVHEFTVAPAIEVAGAADLCPGDAATLRLPVSDTIASHRGRYRWTVNGQEAPDSTGPEFRFTAPANAGNYTIAAHVEDDTSQSTDKAEIRATRKNPGQPADRTTSVHVKEYRNPTATCAADRTDLRRGETTTARVTATGSECGGQLSYRWTASEGTVSGSGASVQYDSTGVAFDPNITDREQTKNVTLTATVTDQKGGTANCAVNITVRYRATAPARPVERPIQLDDIIFAPGSARVNNCAKRILADELYPQMTRNRDYDIVLIGHVAANEQPAPAARRGRRGRTAAPTALDRERVLNTAAFLSAATETCKDIEIARIRVDWVGTDQASDFKSRFCETSVREKKGQAIRSSDPEAKNRRVEIWLVPKGATPPPAVKNLQNAPTEDIRAKGCPK